MVFDFFAKKLGYIKYFFQRIIATQKDVCVQNINLFYNVTNMQNYDDCRYFKFFYFYNICNPNGLIQALTKMGKSKDVVKCSLVYIIKIHPMIVFAATNIPMDSCYLDLRLISVLTEFLKDKKSPGS